MALFKTWSFTSTGTHPCHWNISLVSMSPLSWFSSYPSGHSCLLCHFLFSPAFKHQHAGDPRSSSHSTHSFSWPHLLPRILKPRPPPNSRPRFNFACPGQNTLPHPAASSILLQLETAFYAPLPYQNLSHPWPLFPLSSNDQTPNLWVQSTEEMKTPISHTSLLWVPPGYTQPGPSNWSTPIAKSSQSNHHTITKLIF